MTSNTRSMVLLAACVMGSDCRLEALAKHPDRCNRLP
jgi:hypothetical protein